MSSKLPEALELASPPDLSQPLKNPTRAKTAAGEFGYQRVRLADGLSEGVELLLIETDQVRAAICPTRGMSLWKANINGLNCGWNSAVEGPVHPNYVAVHEGNGLGWLSGFDELLVRCGLQSFGAPDFDDNGQLLYPLHGRIGNLPARNVDIRIDNEHSLLEVSGEVLEVRFLQFNLRLKAKYVFAIGTPTIAIHDTVTNHSGTATTAQMLYHVNVGRPLLEEGSKAYVGAKKAVARNAHAATDVSSWDTYLAPKAGYEEQVYFFAGESDDQGWAKAMLSNKSGDKGFAVHYQTDTLPFFTQWKNTVAESDGYVTGLEPGTGFPNPRSFEETKGRLINLPPGESVEFQLRLEAMSSSAEVAARAKDIQSQSGGKLETAEFDGDWCTPR